ncbi:MAG: hypothetical protein ACR2FY_18090 [Pirellulaceae bacterium]
MLIHTDPDVLNYILQVFPLELESLEQLADELRDRNAQEPERVPADVEPVLVMAMWMRRVLEKAQSGDLDVKGVFELSACLAKEMPKVQALREAELRKASCSASNRFDNREFGKS